MNVLGIAGSLRRNSFNRRMLECAASLSPVDLSIQLFDDLKNVPLFDEDLEEQIGGQGNSAVGALRDRVAKADGLLIATPEYNQSLPGGLKNALDWLSRTDVMVGKSVAILGATPGRWGTRYAQKELRHVLASALECRVMSSPALYVADVQGLMDDNGNLTDQRSIDSLQSFIADFATWVGSAGY